MKYFYRSLLLIGSVLIISPYVHAQIAEARSVVTQFGIGIYSAVANNKSLTTSVEEQNVLGVSTELKYKGIGPYHARFEYMVSNHIGIGLSAYYESGSYEYNYAFTDPDDVVWKQEFKFDYSSISALGRVTYHFINNKTVDIYTALGVGYDMMTTKVQLDYPGMELDESDKALTDAFNKYLRKNLLKLPVAVEGYLGMKWAITPGLGVYAELGYGRSVAQTGLYFKFGNNKGYSRSNWKYYR